MKFYIIPIVTLLVAIALSFIVAMGIWLHGIKQDIRACEAFWNEPCILQPVPKSIQSNFSTEYYNDYNAQMKELTK